MRRIALTLALIAVIVPGLVAAEVYTLTLNNGATFDSRYRPKVSYPDEDTVMLLTSTGNWISFPMERVSGVKVDFEVRGYGRVIDTTTISLGFAPNEGPPADATAADPATRLLRYLEGRDSQRGNATVEQFVNTDSAGTAGFPSSFGAGVASPGAVTTPGAFSGVISPPPPAASSPPADQ